MQDTIFTQIINGDIPSHKVHEDDRTLVFMDIHPIQPGQLLVIPKKQIQFVWDLEGQDYDDLMRVAKQAALRLREVFPGKARVAMHIEGLDVDHAHIKLFAFNTADEFRHVPDASAEPDHLELAKLAEKLAF